MYKNPYQTFTKFNLGEVSKIPVATLLLLLVDGYEERVYIELIPVTYDGKLFLSTLNQGRVHEKLIIAWCCEMKTLNCVGGRNW